MLDHVAITSEGQLAVMSTVMTSLDWTDTSRSKCIAFIKSIWQSQLLCSRQFSCLSFLAGNVAQKDAEILDCTQNQKLKNCLGLRCSCPVLNSTCYLLVGRGFVFVNMEGIYNLGKLLIVQESHRNTTIKGMLWAEDCWFFGLKWSLTVWATGFHFVCVGGVLVNHPKKWTSDTCAPA